MKNQRQIEDENARAADGAKAAEMAGEEWGVVEDDDVNKASGEGRRMGTDSAEQLRIEQEATNGDWEDGWTPDQEKWKRDLEKRRLELVAALANWADGTISQEELSWALCELGVGEYEDMSHAVIETTIEGRTPEDVGASLGLSREQVLKLCDAALLKLRKEIA